MKYCILITFCFLSIKCISQNITKFPVSKNLTSKVVIKDIPAMGIGRIYFTDSLFITQDIRAQENYMKIFNYKNNSSFIQFGKKGRGPKQMITPKCMGVDPENDYLIFYDLNLKKTHYCDLKSFNDSPVKISSLKEIKLRRIWDATYINNNLIIATGMNEEGLFSVIKPEENEYSIQGEMPFKPSVSGNNFFWELNQGCFYVTPDQQHVVYTTINFGYISCYYIDGENLVKEWEHWLTSPNYNTTNGQIRWKYSNILGFMDAAVTNDKIYAIFHGKTMSNIGTSSAKECPETVMVFSIDGKPTAKYHSDVPLIRIGISPAGEVFGISKNLTYDLVKLNL